MSEKVALYGRVSTENQDLSDQEERLTRWAEDQGYDNYELLTEKVSSVKERPKFNELMEKLEQYDVFAVTDLDRFGRSTRDILAQVDRMKENDVSFVTIDQMFDFRDSNEMGEAMRDLMLQMMGAFAEFERKMKRKRMKRNYDKAVEEGKVGRPKALNEEQEEYVISKHESGHSVASIRRLIRDKYDKEVSRTPIERVIDTKTGEEE